MRVLITGATGFVGSELSKFLIEKNIEVYYLSTSKSKIHDKLNYKGFYWNPEKNEIDPECICGVDYIFNLSGKSISCRWNSKNKKEILQSRINSSKVLFDLLSQTKNQVKKIISASAIGIYKNDLSLIQTEKTTDFNPDFLGEVCQKWENENSKFSEIGIQTLIVRFGLVLSNKQGALPQFTKTINCYIGSLLGSGKQWYSWIHIQDLIEMLYFGTNNNITGVINGVAPNPKTQKQFLSSLASVLNKPMFLPRVPSFFLQLVLGEMYHLIIDSQKVSCDKVLNLKFRFKFSDLNEAFQNLYPKKSP